MDLSEFLQFFFELIQRELCEISLCPPKVLGLVIFGSVYKTQLFQDED